MEQKMEEDEEEGRIPPEIKQVLDYGGFSLLIKGAPGTGKTSLALEILRKTRREGIYVSTRVSPESLYMHFPWLERCIEPLNIIDTSQIYTTSDLKVYSTALGGVVSFPERLAKRIEELGPNTTIVIDSWDAITEQMEPSKTRTLEALITELVREKEVNLILTTEKMQTTYLDYMVDGVIITSDIRVENTRAKELETTKLRMASLKQPKYPFTLHKAKFTCFMPFTLKPIPLSPAKITPVPNPEGFISTTSKILDDVLGGGFKKGSFNVFEVGSGIATWGFETLVGFTIMNMIAQGNHFVYIPSYRRGESYLRKRILPFIREEDYKRYVKIFEIIPGEEEISENTEILEGKSIEEDLATVRDYISKLKSPVIRLIGADTLEYYYNLRETRQLGTAVKEISKCIINTKVRGNVDIVKITQNLEIADQLIDMASTYFKVIPLDQTVVFYGIKPETPLYNIDNVFVDGYPKLELTPIV